MSRYPVMPRMLFGRAGWERIAPKLDAAGIGVDPVLLEPDGGLSHGGAPVSLFEAGIEMAWFSPELFAANQDEAFLDVALAAPALVWMQSGRAGYDHPAFARLVAKQVRVSMSKAPAPAIAEYVLTQVLDHFQRGPERRAAQHDAIWRPLPFREISGSRWLLIGYGEIGSGIAARARSLGVHVTGVRRSGGSDPAADAMLTPDTMAEALAVADVVVLSVPLTKQNDGAYGAAFFAGFRAGALFVNIGRGQLLDEEALRLALDAGTFGHAVLDVTRIEPLPASAWQWRHPMVTLTAHTSGMGSGLLDRTDALLVGNLQRYLMGEPLVHELDPGVFL